MANTKITAANIDSTSTGITLADLTVDTTTLVVDATNNRVGIGTDNPGQQLHVHNSGSTFIQVGNNNGSVLYGVNTAGNAFVSGQTSSKDLIFEVNNGNNMRLHNSGKVGIGTGNTTPTGKLTIANPTAYAPNTVTAGNSYIQLGSTDYGSGGGSNNDGKFMIGFGYTDGTTNTHSPAYIGFEETSTSGDTKGDLTFYTRDVITDTAPTQRMRITDGGNVGINEISPNAYFHVTGKPSYTTAASSEVSGLGFVRLQPNSDSEHSLWFHNAGNNLGISGYTNAATSSTRDITLQTYGGKLLIGDSASHTDDLLQIETPASGGGHGIQIRRNDSNADQGIGRIMFGNNTDTDLASIFVKTDGSTDNAAMTFNTQPNGGALTERMRIDSSGNVGIGTNNPLNTAHIYGTGQTTANLAESGNQGGMLRITDANTAAGAGGAILFANYYADDEPSMGFAAIKGVLNNGSTYTQGSLAFSTRNAINSTSMTERMRLKYNGNFGIGDTDPDAKLTVVASSVSGGVVKIKDTDATTSLGNTVLGLYFTNDDDCTDATYIGMYDSGSRIGSITVASATSVSYNTTSDYRLKENVTYDFNALDRILQLKPARFNWISDETNTLVDGFLAHEVQDIVPEAIHGEKDAVMEEEYEITPAVLDDDGFVVTEAEMGTREVPDYQGIDQSKLVPLLTKAIQEQQTIIDDLKSRIETLEG